ncbi:unnamed protein product [Ectocarpus sp. 4 AP-2014]
MDKTHEFIFACMMDALLRPPVLLFLVCLNATAPPLPRLCTTLCYGTNTRAKLRALLSQEEKLEQAMASLEKAASGNGLKEGESQGQMKAARAAWEAGRDALQEYVEVANKGMIRSLRKIDTPFAT